MAWIHVERGPLFRVGDVTVRFVPLKHLIPLTDSALIQLVIGDMNPLVARLGRNDSCFARALADPTDPRLQDRLFGTGDRLEDGGNLVA